MKNPYANNGYVYCRNFLNGTELTPLRNVIEKFHQSWKQENAEFYTTRAINSAYLTGRKHLDEIDRTTLFQFIGSAKLMEIVTGIMGDGASFMNTQLFFNPVNAAQKNYWHRDSQYDLSITDQQQALHGPNAMHFRIPLVDEPGLELVPGTHKRWDSQEELDVRLERNGHRNYEPLASGVTIPLNAGDLLAFSANMIHRGIYGKDRLSLDILFCDPVPELLQHADASCLPDEKTLCTLEKPRAFLQAIELKNTNRGSSTPQ
ncbi:phytanoyl-CoA dioxygenase family protein [Microbulbifer sp. ALW1]|uniref:phytanoyl-CoA dioxygenase family protein n=1 Tax=Microbulbifer sp. (strain ALW1) TaxID=1516059 RepID=UPI00135B93F0|nr:phytanoyl-CoA dioxygenase family protein [Microbulbifer sp. ALW1]